MVFIVVVIVVAFALGSAVEVKTGWAAKTAASIKDKARAFWNA